MRVGIIGAGLIGKKRAAALVDSGFILAQVADAQLARAEALAQLYPDVMATSNVDELLRNPQLDAVFICTLHDSLAPLTRAAIQGGKHVLVEKPGARRAAELQPLVALAQEKKVTVRVGYNHRFHPTMQLAKKLIETGALGPLLLLRARYGHGGRLGYENEWRANPALSGGGELIDQGVHLIDLARWYFGDFSQTRGTVKTLFWNMPVDDNAFVELQTTTGQVAWLHASCSEWKNLFSLEIYGRHAKILIEGLGGSYGPEKLVHYRMKPEMGPPEIDVHEFPATDASWALEIAEFYRDITQQRVPSPSLHDAIAVLAHVEEVYRQNQCSFV